jgi:hypothetical protein
MQASIKHGGIAGCATALFIWLRRVDTSWWIDLATMLIAALVLAAISVCLYWSQNPSVTRFRRIARCGGASAYFLATAGILVLYHFVPALDSGIAVLVAVPWCAAVVGYHVWLDLAVMHYGRRGPDDPDFAEDDAGNPIQSKSPE